MSLLWDDVRKVLHQYSAPSVRATAVQMRYAGPAPNDLREHALFLGQAESPHVAEVQALVYQLLATGRTQARSAAAQYWLGLRFDTTACFLDLLCTTPEKIPCPFPDPQSAIGWLLLVWWPDQGYYLAASQRGD